MRKRLKRLWDHDYLVGDRLQLTRERIYFLAEKGLEALRLAGMVDQRRLYQARGMETLRMLQHPLLVSECAVRFVECLRSPPGGTEPVELLELAPLGVPFLHTHAVGDARKRRHTERFVTQEDLRVPGEPEALRIRPDLVFGLTVQGQSRLFFLEADLGSEGPAQIARKLLAYHHFREAVDPERLDRLLWQRYGVGRDLSAEARPARGLAKVDFRVLLVTVSEQRVRNLWRYLDGLPGSELLAVATVGGVKEGDVVQGEVWRVATKRDQVSLLG